MIKIENLTKTYGQIKALDNISFDVNEGEVLGFLGPNGAGKTTTMNILTGYIPPTYGKVTVDGFDVMDSPYEVKKRIGYLPESPPLYFDMTVKEYLYFVCDLKNVDRSKRKKHVEEIVSKLKIEGVFNRLIKNLSKGYKQRVGFAQALIGSPKVLILDEPTVGLDPKQVIEIRKLIASLKKNHTIIFSSHILSEVSAVADRVVIINNGRIAAVDTRDGKDSKGRVRYAVSCIAPKSEALNIIKGIPGVKEVSRGSFKDERTYEFIIETDGETDIRENLFFEMAKNNYPIVELTPLKETLEDIFINVITRERKEVL